MVTESQETGPRLPCVTPPKRTRGKGRRTGKIARLPRPLRDKISQMIDDGLPYEDIAQKVKAESGIKLDYHRLSVWMRGGYKDWLEDQRRVKEMDKNREFALNVVKRSKGKAVAEAGLDVAASQLYELLNEFDFAGLKKELTEKPEAYPVIVGILTKVSEGGLKFERHRATEARDKVTQKVQEAKMKREDEKWAIEKHARNSNGVEEARESDEEMDEVLRALRVM
jgi:hypothetical protein